MTQLGNQSPVFRRVGSLCTRAHPTKEAEGVEWVGGLGCWERGVTVVTPGAAALPSWGEGGKEKVSVLAGGHSFASLAGRAAQPAYSPVSAWASEQQDRALGGGGCLTPWLAGGRGTGGTPCRPHAAWHR